MDNNHRKTIFLSGSMRGVDRNLAKNWRLDLTNRLETKFKVLHAYLGREIKETMPNPKGAVVRDKGFVLESDVVLVNDSFPDVPMIGTAMEIQLAYNSNIPVIIFGSANKGNYFLEYHSHVRVSTVDDAIKLIEDLFNY